MQMIEFDSQLIFAAGYDPQEEVLRVTFRKKGVAGDTWEYEEVGPEVWEALRSSESAGKFFLARIKTNYRGHKVGG